MKKRNKLAVVTLTAASLLLVGCNRAKGVKEIEAPVAYSSEKEAAKGTDGGTTAETEGLTETEVLTEAQIIIETEETVKEPAFEGSEAASERAVPEETSFEVKTKLSDVLTGKQTGFETEETEETEPEETTPAETEPEETLPPATEPVETTPAPTLPPETAPVETTPAATLPPVTAPVETTPAPTLPPETAPVETTPAETLPPVTEPVYVPEPTTEPPTEPEITPVAPAVVTNIVFFEDGTVDFSRSTFGEDVPSTKILDYLVYSHLFKDFLGADYAQVMLVNCDWDNSPGVCLCGEIMLFNGNTISFWFDGKTITVR